MDQQQIIEFLESEDRRRDARRAFLRAAGGTSLALAGAGFLSGCDDNDDMSPTPTPAPSPTPTPTPPATTSDQDILNFALNLEYLEAQFYNFAAFGRSIPGDQLTGTGRPGAPNGARQVTFTDPVVGRFAREVAANEASHVRFLRTTLGSVAIAQPDLDLSPGGAFSAAARAAGVISAGATFDPYASDENFLLAAFIFEDVGVTAYKGASPLITSKTILEAAAGILATEAYQASAIRTLLYRKGIATPTLISSADKISDARDSLDGASDLDQGISPTGTGANIKSNIVPSDDNGIAFSRTTGQVLNIAYLNKAKVTSGGFFPNGVNGKIVSSAASG